MSTDRSWDARPVAARCIRALVLLAPISIGCAAAIGANRAIAPATTLAPALGRSLLIVVISSAVVWGTDRVARKLLPLAALMQLSLVFPDQAPSRFRSALKAGSSRRLERTLADTRRNGLAKDPGDAARQVVQLIGAIGDHDRRTRGHSERVRLFADLVGEELKLSKEERQKLQWGALLHDLGKLMVPSEILNKKGKPDDEEWRILQGHPAAGMELIEPLRGFLGEWVHAIGGHHEKWDGSGYPAGLRGSQIPRAAAIVAVADSFEVMTAVRSYKKAMPLVEARAELTRCAGTHFSPEVVRAFLSISLGHLRIVAGPLAALAHLPFLGNLSQLPGAAAAAAPALANAAAIPAAAVVTAAALAVGAPPRADALEMVNASRESAAAAASVASGSAAGSGATSTGDADATPNGSGGPVGAASSQGPTAPEDAGPTNVATGDTPSTPSVAGDVTTTAPPSGGAPATTTPPIAAAAPVATAAPATTAKPVAPPTTKKATTTTTTTPAPPPTTSPSTTLAPPTSVAVTGPTYELQVTTNGLRLLPQNLNGASFPRGSTIYVYSPISAKEVKYTYPGGNKTSKDYPYDLMGAGLLAANGYRLPSTPGTYTISAVAKTDGSGQGSGNQFTASATFTVT